MSDLCARPADLIRVPSNKACSWRGVLRGGENHLLAIILAVLVGLPLAEILLRTFLRSGVPGSNSFVQQCTLLIGMLGGAVAARELRLLSLSSLTSFLARRTRALALGFSSAVGAAVSIVLTVASFEFLLTEREGGKLLALGIPVWVVQLVLPVGFGLVAWRLIMHAAGTWKGRTVALAGAALVASLPLWFPLAPESFVAPGLVVLLVATILGAPVFVTIAGATLILLWGAGMPVASIPLKHYSLVTNPTLPTIPLFTLAGYFLAEGGASKRLVRVFQTLVGPFRGGPAVVTVVTCAFFTSFTGASGVTILALGGLLMPVLLSARYSEKNALGLLTGAGSLGLLFPPCLPLILYAVVAGTVMANMGVAAAAFSEISMEQMFLAGLGPGLLLVILTAWWGIRVGRPGGTTPEPVVLSDAAKALWAAKWELGLPVVVVIALFGGFATPVEAAACTAFYAFFIETFVYRDLNLFRDVPRVMTECGLLVGGVLLILGVAMGFSNYLVIEQIPMHVVDWVTENIHSRWLFLLILNVSLLVVGCLMDVFSAIVVVVPLIVPVALAFGIDPVHLGILFLANLELGYLTPPVGMNLFLSSYRFNKPLPEVYRSVVPVFFVLLIGVLIITYVPPLTLWLPGLFR